MTALDEYLRLEATGYWKASSEATSREVVVKLGDASLVMCDHHDVALSHWSLPAVIRLNPGEAPARYAPHRESDEMLELADNEQEMVAGIAKLSQALERRNRRGRLRRIAAFVLVPLLCIALIVWFPGAARFQALRATGDAQKADIGAALFERLEARFGPACDSPRGATALATLAERIYPDEKKRLSLMPALGRPTLTLPDGHVLIDNALVQDFDSPEVLAGVLVSDKVAANAEPPFETLIQGAALGHVLRFLATGEMSEQMLDSHAESLSRPAGREVDDLAFSSEMQALELDLTTWALARDLQGLPVSDALAEAEAAQQTTRAALGDQDWLSLQLMCP